MYNGTAEVGSPQSAYTLTQPSTSLMGRAVIQNAQYTVNYYFEYSDSRGEFEKIAKTGTAQIGSTITPPVTPDGRSLAKASYKSVEYAGSTTHNVYSNAEQQSAVVKADGSTTIEYKYYFSYIMTYIVNGKVIFLFYYPSAASVYVPVWMGEHENDQASWLQMTKEDNALYDRYWNFMLDNESITWSKLGTHSDAYFPGTESYPKDFHLYVYDDDGNVIISTTFSFWVKDGRGYLKCVPLNAIWNFDISGSL